MLRTNLATRPFYNVRAVRVVVGVLALLAIAATAYNVVQVVRLTALERELGADAAVAESEAARLQAEASGLRARIDEAEIARLGGAVAEANAIIDRRTFSWVALLAQFERTLPRDVRITRIQPREQRGASFVVSVDFEFYDVADLREFTAALRATEAFDRVIVHNYEPADGIIGGHLEVLYRPANAVAPDGAATAPAEAAGSGGNRG